MSDPQYKQAAFDLYLAYNQEADHFSAILFRLLRKATGVNFTKLCEAFPLEGQVFKDWYNSPTEQEFYDKAGVRTHRKSVLPNCS